MSRLASWVDKDLMEREDVHSIIRDDMVDIEQWRLTELSEQDGFREQTPKRKMVLIDRIKGRIDRRDAIYRTQNGESAKVSDQLFIATVYKRDIRPEDVLKLNGIEYKVRFINKTTQSFTEVELDIKI